MKVKTPRLTILLAMLLGLALLTAAARAAESMAAEDASHAIVGKNEIHAAAPIQSLDTLPAVPKRPVWVVPMLISIALLFTGALAARLIYNANMTDQPPVDDSHGGHGNAHHGDRDQPIDADSATHATRH